MYAIDSLGNVATFISGTVGLSNPNAIVFDENDNLYVLNADGGFLSKFDANGSLLNLNVMSGLSTPQGLAIHPTTGIVYVSDDSGVIYQVDEVGGNHTIYADTQSTTEGGLVFDNAGNLYLSAYNAGNILKISTGDQQVSLCVAGISQPRGLTFDPSSNIVVTSFDTGQILTFNGCQTYTEGTISGYVYDSSNPPNPLSGINVNLIDVNVEEIVANFCTLADGSYTMIVPFDQPMIAIAGGHYGSCGNPSTYAFEFYDNVNDGDFADHLVVTAITPTVNGIDFTLEAGGTIRGTLYDSDTGQPIQNYAIETDFPAWGDDICTDALGQFEFTGIPFDAPFKIRATGRGLLHKYHTLY